MPVSAVENKSTVQEWYRAIDPDIVVDIGPGEGTYAKLMNGINTRAIWFGIEAWGPYVGKYHLHDHYDEVIIADIRYTALERVATRPDLVIIGDVLEHLTKPEAQQTLDRLRTWCPNVIVSIPLIHLPQEPYEGNWFEIHRDHWYHEEMIDFLGKGLRDTKKGDILGYYWWSLSTTPGEYR